MKRRLKNIDRQYKKKEKRVKHEKGRQRIDSKKTKKNTDPSDDTDQKPESYMYLCLEQEVQ